MTVLHGGEGGGEINSGYFCLQSFSLFFFFLCVIFFYTTASSHNVPRVCSVFKCL